LCPDRLFLCNMLGKCGGGPAFDSRYGGAAAATACALLLGGSALLCHLAWRPTAGAEAVGFAVLYGLGYGGSFALVQSKAALHFGHRRGFKTLQGFLFGWQMAGMITGELLTPELAHAFSYTAAFAVIAAVAATALLALLAFEKREAQIGPGTSLKVPLV
jgi:MFS family permease